MQSLVSCRLATFHDDRAIPTLEQAVPAVVSKTGKHIILPEQGRSGLKGRPPGDLGDLPAYRDPDRTLPVWLCVYQPASQYIRLTPRDLHWSIGWHVTDYHQPPSKSSPVWRQINVVAHDRDYEPPPNPRLVYWRATTTSVGDMSECARTFELGKMSLQTRVRIEELATTVPVMVPDGTWNCQDFIKDLMERMVTAGIINQDKMDSVIEEAEIVSF